MNDPKSDAPELLPVEQVDRDAACSLLGHEHPSWWRIKTERGDSSAIVQAFARHRLNTTQPALASEREPQPDYDDTPPPPTPGLVEWEPQCEMCGGGRRIPAASMWREDGSLAHGQVAWLSCPKCSPPLAPGLVERLRTQEADHLAHLRKMADEHAEKFANGDNKVRDAHLTLIERQAAVAINFADFRALLALALTANRREVLEEAPQGGALTNQDAAEMVLAEFTPGTVYLPDADCLEYWEADESSVSEHLPSGGASVQWDADRSRIIGVAIYGVRRALASEDQRPPGDAL